MKQAKMNCNSENNNNELCVKLCHNKSKQLISFNIRPYRCRSNFIVILAFFLLICLCHHENDCWLLRVLRAPNHIGSVEALEKSLSL